MSPVCFWEGAYRLEVTLVALTTDFRVCHTFEVIGTIFDEGGEGMNHKCTYCGKEIEYKDMQVDHVVPKCSYNSTDDIENLMPSCRRCNHYKRANSLATFRRYLLEMKRKLIDESYLGKVAMDYNMLEWTGWDGKFYYERVAEREEIIE